MSSLVSRLARFSCPSDARMPTELSSLRLSDVPDTRCVVILERFASQLRLTWFSLVPWSAKDHRLQEVGFHSSQERRIPAAKERGQATTVRICHACISDVSSSDHVILQPSHRDGAYVQFLKPHGNLVTNLKALEKVAASA